MDDDYTATNSQNYARGKKAGNNPSTFREAMTLPAKAQRQTVWDERVEKQQLPLVGERHQWRRDVYADNVILNGKHSRCSGGSS